MLQYFQQVQDPSLSVIKFLCDHGVNAGQENKAGLTSLRYIMDKIEKQSEGYHDRYYVGELFETVALLITKGAQVETKSTTVSTLTALVDKYQNEISTELTKEIKEEIQKQTLQKDEGQHIPAAFKDAMSARKNAIEAQKEEDEGPAPNP